MSIQKGDYGYIRNRKKNALIGVFMMVAIGLIVFLIGLLLNDMSNRNVFTVAAVLFVLPGAKFLVRFIVTFPYNSVEKERYDNIKSHVGENMQLYADMIITSSEKVMHLDFVVVGNRQVIGLVGRDKQDISYIRKYLSDGVGNWGESYKVKILDSEKIFLKELDSVTIQETDKEEEENVKSFLTSLIV